jgi:hypothetical protein
MTEPDAIAARRAYVGAIAAGVKPHVAFDLAKAAYRAKHSELEGDRLAEAVARVLATALKDVAKVLD